MVEESPTIMLLGKLERAQSGVVASQGLRNRISLGSDIIGQQYHCTMQAVFRNKIR